MNNTMNASKKLSAIEIKVLAVNLLNQYAKKFSEYEQTYFNQFIGKDILKVDGSLKAKFEHEKLSEKTTLENGCHFTAHYWFTFGYHSFDMHIKICVNGGSWDVKPSTAFTQYEESTYTLFDTDDEGKVKATQRFNNDYTKQYDAQELIKQANELEVLAKQYESAERHIPHYFRSVLNVQHLTRY